MLDLVLFFGCMIMIGVYPDCHWLPCPAEYLSKSGNKKKFGIDIIREMD